MSLSRLVPTQTDATRAGTTMTTRPHLLHSEVHVHHNVAHCGRGPSQCNLFILPALEFHRSLRGNFILAAMRLDTLLIPRLAHYHYWVSIFSWSLAACPAASLFALEFLSFISTNDNSTTYHVELRIFLPPFCRTRTFDVCFYPNIKLLHITRNNSASHRKYPVFVCFGFENLAKFCNGSQQSLALLVRSAHRNVFRFLRFIVNLPPDQKSNAHSIINAKKNILTHKANQFLDKRY